MPHFFFHLITPDRIERDEIGLHLPTSVAACREARHAIPLVSAELIENGCDPMRCRFRIEDAAGREIAVVPFADLVHRAPARGPRFRSASALQRLAHAAYRGVFEGSPNAYLVLTPDFSIVGANDAYLDAIGRPRDALVGHNAFDAFPENPNDEAAKSGSQLRASFQRALRSLARDTLPLQRYDLMDANGNWSERYWRTVNWPILDEQGAVIALAHHTVDVTRNALAHRHSRRPRTVGAH